MTVKDKCKSEFRVRECSNGDFPGGPVFKNLPCNAGDMGLILGQGTKIPHSLEQETLHPTRPRAAPQKRENVQITN